jgi:hypothetical protein
MRGFSVAKLYLRPAEAMFPTKSSIDINIYMGWRLITWFHHVHFMLGRVCKATERFYKIELAYSTYENTILFVHIQCWPEYSVYPVTLEF